MRGSISKVGYSEAVCGVPSRRFPRVSIVQAKLAQPISGPLFWRNLTLIVARHPWSTLIGPGALGATWGAYNVLTRASSARQPLTVILGPQSIWQPPCTAHADRLSGRSGVVRWRLA